MGVETEIISSSLLFILVFGMSATVDINSLRQQLRNKRGILTGIFVQFIILPFFGFATVQALNLDDSLGLTLMVITSSPGGSYSNWWCSMFNADLALSVTMTAISTAVSTVMLPLNLIMYSRSKYGNDIVDDINWLSLFIALAIVIGSIGSGLLCSAKIHSRRFNLLANKIGNLAGLSLVIFSIVISQTSKSHEKLWDHNWKFYVGIASPCVLGLLTANLIASLLDLKKPDRVTVSVESCYQNAGIATSVAINMFQGEKLEEAIAVPLYYGLVEMVTLGIYCVFAWKIGWTKAPSDESFCVILTSSYEVEKAQHVTSPAVEVVLGTAKQGAPFDLVFELDSKNHDNSVVGVSYPQHNKTDIELPTTTSSTAITTTQGKSNSNPTNQNHQKTIAQDHTIDHKQINSVFVTSTNDGHHIYHSPDEQDQNVHVEKLGSKLKRGLSNMNANNGIGRRLSYAPPPTEETDSEIEENLSPTMV